MKIKKRISFNQRIQDIYGKEYNEFDLWRALLKESNINNLSELKSTEHYIGFTRNEMRNIFIFKIKPQTDFYQGDLDVLIDGMIRRFKKYIYSKSFSHSTAYGKSYKFDPQWLEIDKKNTEKIFK